MKAIDIAINALEEADQHLSAALVAADFDPAALAARGLTATAVSDGLSSWFRDVFAGTQKARDGEWLV